MKIKPTLRARKGVALILVLAAIVLITALVIGLMARALSERKSSASYSAVANTKQLSDTVVNLVQAQINDATAQGSTNAWASQPGAIRVFDNSGNLSRIYKLYSESTLTTNNASSLTNDIPANATWTNASALWVDLNAPVTYTTSSGTSMAFPILDPRDPASSATAPTISTNAGFALASLPGAQPNFNQPKYQPAPMPVKWLYVLRDGKLIAPDSTSTTVATFASSSVQPSQQNPITGRIAFWTDDDSCKVNINTAGDGTFWDTPHFDTTDERFRARYQPAQKEFQAYPGHPATTTLREIFPTLTSEALFNLLPRYSFGGSKGGTAVATGAVPAKTGGALRLFSSTGELLFDYARNPNGLSRQQMDSSKFFLTARSRAPEVNLFGKPRVAIWPLHSTDSTTFRTATDRLIAFCSTVNGLPYYFTRQNPVSATTDISLSRNSQLLSYLDTLTSTAVPGFGGNFSTKYGADQRQILTEIFDYIRISNLRDPNVGTPYSRKDLGTGTYPDSPDLGSIGQVIPSYKQDWNTRGFGRFPVLSEVALLVTGAGRGAANPVDASKPAIPVDPAQPSGLPLGYVPSSPGTAPTTATTPPDNTTAIQSFVLMSFFNPTYGWSGMQMGFSVKVTGLGAVTVSSGTSLPVPLGLRDGSLTLAGRSTTDFYHGRDFGFVDVRAILTYKRKGDPTPYEYNYMRELGANALTDFPFYGNIIEIPNQSGSMSIYGAGIQVSVYSGQNTNDESKLVQRYNINFPANGSVSAPIPGVLPHPTSDPGHSNRAPWRFGSPASDEPWQDRIDTWWLPGSITTNDNGPYVINTRNDTIISTVPTGIWTDYRLFALHDDMNIGVPASAFAPHSGNPASSNQGIRYGFKLAAAGNFPEAFSGNLVAAIPKQANWDNVASVHLNGANAGVSGSVPGDWDNGMARDNAGPYINKADEGNINDIANYTPYFDSDQNFTPTGPTFFSPNRQIQSAVMFGSLSSGAKADAPWQTLLFRPAPTGHKGLQSPKDHLLLDLFWMPVAEPYAISEPFSTAGKINMNYQIVPFSNITRPTGIRAVLAGQKVAMVPAALGSTARHALNLSDTNGTLRQFRERFAAGEIFKSATEICDIYLVPTGKNWASDSSAQSDWYGNDFARVGDNVRERPYADIYPRLTTKSNVYTIHYTVQALKSPTTANQSQWDDARGTIAGEYRGSTTLERYIDPNNAAIPDYPTTTDPNPLTLDSFYRWRIIENAQFAP